MHFDVAIVGARVAGSTLAALLGRRGLRVLLLDQAAFPSDTFSTHVVNGDSFGIWEEAGAWPRVQAVGATPLLGIRWQRQAPAVDIEGYYLPKNGYPYALCLRRFLLDEALFETASETPGVTAWTNTRVVELLWDKNRVVGLKYEQREGTSKTTGQITAELVVGADGRYSFVAEAVGSPVYNRVDPIWFPFYAYVRGVEPIDPPMLEIIDSEQAKGTIMLAPADSGIWIAVLYSPQSEFSDFRKAHAKVFWERLRSEPKVAGRLANAEAVGPVRGRNDMVNMLRVAAGPGWALVGDSGQHKDPIYGQGMGDATRTASLLATQVVRAFSGELDLASALAEFHAYRDLDLLPGYDWMIKDRPRDLDPAEYHAYMNDIGSSPARSQAFISIFNHAVSSAEFFGPQAIAAWRQERIESAQSNRKAESMETLVATS